MIKTKMKIALVGTFPPRECGIATFSNNLLNALRKQILPQAEIFVVAVQAPQDEHRYPEIVEFVIRQERQADYIEAAKFVNFSGADLCLVQHEYGIYGGASGVYLLSLIHQLTIPVFATLHTVLETPSFSEKVIVQKMAEKARRLIVMSRKAVSFLTDVYGIPAGQTAFVPHGVPDINYKHGLRCKQELNLEKKKTLLTFGLLSRNKGIETVINVLPEAVRRHPELVYIVLGKTHPNVKRVSGEEYRSFLMRRVEQLGLERHVYFYDQFVSEKKLVQYLAAADIYITPYLNKRQITSGTLSYAVGAGAAVLSTPYWHAEEMLAGERGFLFGFNDEVSLSDILLRLLDNPKELEKVRRRAYAYGRQTIWPEIGGVYLNLFGKDIDETVLPAAVAEAEPTFSPADMPAFSLDHVVRLTDETGIIQHARYSVPYLKDGYCTDDNARALVMTLMAYRQEKNAEAFRLMGIYLRFLMYMQNEDGQFRNFLSFDRKYLDENGTDDSFGRTMWSLGYLVRYPPNEVTFQIGREMFERAIPHIAAVRSLRAMSFCITGLVHFLARFPDNEACLRLLRERSQVLLEAYRDESSAEWRWFEPVIAYDNGVIPMALLLAWRVLRRDELKETAFEAAAFLESFKFRNGFLNIVGSNGWYPKGGRPAVAAQQAVNAMALTLFYQTAFSVTHEPGCLEKMYRCYKWFLGENFLRMPLYDFESKGCNDGLERDQVNRNQGAESTLAFLISHMAVLAAYEEKLVWSGA